jgi:glycosyl-4,4'-diaponeurosporenoate acyltransferase
LSASKWFSCLLYLGFIAIAAQPVGAILPRTMFRADRFPYRLMGWERDGRIYDKLRIRNWKDKMPDMSRIIGLKKRILPNVCESQVLLLIKETCVAEFVHLALIFLGLHCVSIIESAFAIVVCGLWGVGNLVFVLIQRYNRPILIRLAAKLHDRELACGAVGGADLDCNLQA